MLRMAFLLVYKRGKTTPDFGALHGSDVVEFYGDVVTGTPDFIGTDAVGMFSSYHLCAWYDLPPH